VADLPDRDPHLGLLVRGEVVEHHDIARVQRRHQHLFDVREKTWTIDRPVEDCRRGKTLETQRGNNSVRMPMTAGRVIPESSAARAPAVTT
jgi:hypothetical protein